MDRSRYVIKKAPAEKVRTKRQLPPESWEVVYGAYREKSTTMFPSLSMKKDMATGLALNRKFRRYNPFSKLEHYHKQKKSIPILCEIITIH